MSKNIYFDHSATTPLDEDVLKAMMPYFKANYGNPSSIHTFGQKAMLGVEVAKTQSAKFLNCAPDEVVFTAGATESNNLALFGTIEALKRKFPNTKLHIITSMIEHDSVLEPIAKLEKQGVEVTHLPVRANGTVDPEELKNNLKDSTVLVSIMYVNSEVGSIQSIESFGKIIKKHNDSRLKQWLKIAPADRPEKPMTVLFHTDATQAANYVSCNTKLLRVDMLSLSAHKIYGPKGVGLLYIKTGTPVLAQMLGGHHQQNRRSGTLNTPGIAGLGKALEKITKSDQVKQNLKIAKNRDYLVTTILKNIPETILNTDTAVSTPCHAHFSFLGVEGESILIALDLAGIAVSTGSACASNSLKASHVLVAMGIRVEVAHSSLRITLGKYNTKSDVDKLVKTLPPIIKNLRKFNPLYKKTD